MVFINEFLPNPSGSDAEGEWVELWNSGPTSINLAGWTLMTKGEKGFSLGGKTIGSREYLLLPRSETKLTLHNTDGALALYGADGKLADEVRFLGTAPEGKSFSRIRYNDYNDYNDYNGFMFADPTLGARNIFTEQLASVAQGFPIGQPLNSEVGLPGILGMALGAGLVLAGLIMLALLQNEDFKNLFFKGNAKIR